MVYKQHFLLWFPLKYFWLLISYLKVILLAKGHFIGFCSMEFVLMCLMNMTKVYMM